jgi:hypothetical protein
MAATALIKFAQNTVGTGGDGIAFIGVLSQLVTVSNANNTGVQSWQIDLVYVDGSSGISPATPFAFSDNGSTPTATFTPDVRRSYRFVLKVWDVPNRAGTPDIDIRNFTVPEFNGVIIPSVQIWPQPLPDPASSKPGAKPNEMNFAGQSGGWAGTGADGLMNNQLTKMFVTSVRERWVDLSSPIAFSKQNGSKNLPYQSIQQALNDVAAGADDSAWSIHVAPGAYNETLTIPTLRKIALLGLDYVTTSINMQSHDPINWSCGGLVNLTLRNIQAYSVIGQDPAISPPISPNKGVLYLNDASVQTLTQAAATFDVVGVGPNTYIETATTTGRYAMDGVDHVGTVTCGTLVAYDSLFNGGICEVQQGDATIEGCQLDPNTQIDFTGYAQKLYVDGTSNYWLGASSVTVTGSPILTLTEDVGPSVIESKEINTGTTYTLDATDAGKLLWTVNANEVEVTIPQDSSVHLPIGTTIYFQRRYLGSLKLNGSAVQLLAPSLPATARTQYSLFWITKTDTNDWAAGGDMALGATMYPVSAGSFTITSTHIGVTLFSTDASLATINVPDNTTLPVPIGHEIRIIRGGSGAVTIAGSGSTVTSAYTLSLRAQWSRALLTKTATNSWVLSGDLAP